MAGRSDGASPAADRRLPCDYGDATALLVRPDGYLRVSVGPLRATPRKHGEMEPLVIVFTPSSPLALPFIL